MPMEVTHSTIKNDKKEVTHYDIHVDGAKVGVAMKTEKGKFNFKVLDGAGKDLEDQKTMRDLKVEVSKNVPKAFVEANKPAPKPKAAPKAKPAKGGDPLESQLAATDAAEEGEDINLE